MSDLRPGRGFGVGVLVLASLLVPASIAQTPSFTTSPITPGSYAVRDIIHPLAPQQITQNSDPNTLVGGTSVGCSSGGGGGGFTTDNHWWRLFDLDDDHGLLDTLTVESIDYGIETAIGPTQNITVTTYCLDEGLPFQLAFLDQVGTTTQPQPDAELEFFNIAVGGTCDTATQDLAVDLSSDDCLSGTTVCDCCTGGNGTGCDCAPCEDKVCTMDLFCCAVFWDAACDEEAQANCTCCSGQDPGSCDGGGGPSGCNCCSGGDGIGCDDATCSDAVCAVDWFCCEVAWDPLCNAIAESQCTCCPSPPPLGTGCVRLLIGCNDLGQSAPTYIHAVDCGEFEPVDLADLGFPNAHMVMIVNGAADGGGGDGAGDGAGDGGDGGGVPAADGAGLLVMAALLLAASAYLRRRWFSGSAGES